MTRQELFDKAVRAVILQGRPATAEAGNCAYRTSSGDRCAVGHLFNDREIKAYGEAGGNISNLLSADEGRTMIGKRPVLRKLFTREARFLTELQRCHDHGANRYPRHMWLQSFAETCRKLAERYNLDDAVIDEALKERGAS